MFVLVSFGKPAVRACQGVTLGNLVCEPVYLIDNMCLCRRLLCLCLLLQKQGNDIFPATARWIWKMFGFSIQMMIQMTFSSTIMTSPFEFIFDVTIHTPPPELLNPCYWKHAVHQHLNQRILACSCRWKSRFGLQPLHRCHVIKPALIDLISSLGASEQVASTTLT